MGLMTLAILGSVVALALMAAGFVWLGVRREFQISRMTPEQAGDMVTRGWRGRPGAVWFKGAATGVSVFAEKPVAEILALLGAGRFGEGLPWATPALGALLAFFFWPPLIELILGLRGWELWAMALVFFAGGLLAAWPRGSSRAN